MDETKRLVLENYPVDRLPEEIREHFSGDTEVLVTIQAGSAAPPRRAISEILDAMQDERTAGDDPVERIRALRAEWDHRDELHARIRRGETI